MQERFNEAKTQEYYDSFGDVYEAVWNEQIHTGFFDKEKSLEQATQDMNVFLANEVEVRKGSTILTIGCGRGGTDRFLVKERGAKVIGIDLSERQLEEAKKRAEAEGLEGSINYTQGSMIAIPVADKIADYVWLQEVFFHCHDKTKATRELNRVLTDSGLIVMEDTVLGNENARGEVLEKFGQRVSINEILTPAEYERLFAETGFRLEKSHNLSEYLSKTYAAIVEHIRKNKDLIQSKIPVQYHKKLDTAFGFPASLQLVNEGKLGCYAFIFRKVK